MSKLSSLTIFFPFRNDAGTVSTMIEDAYRYGRQVTDDLEVIAIYGGVSEDHTWDAICEMKKLHPDLIVIDRKDNAEGYGVIKSGFQAASRDWVFYTDGDSQYHLDELSKLVDTQIATGVDVVNGYKTSRQDGVDRIWLGRLYAGLARRILQLPIHDCHCDFRLIRIKHLRAITLTQPGASVLGELILKLHQAGATFAEVPVHHYARVYGTSNYTPWRLTYESMMDIVRGLKIRYHFFSV